MKEEYIREETLRNRSDEIKLYRKQHKRSDRYPDQIEYKAEITSVRVAESPKFIHRLFRYFLLTKFQGKTQVTLSFEQEINPPLLSVVDSVYFWNLPIEKVSRTVQGDYDIIIERTDMNRVEAEIHEVFESICHHAHSRKHLEIGEYAYPDITYQSPVSIFNELLCMVNYYRWPW